jgi:hypothetical protein
MERSVFRSDDSASPPVRDVTKVRRSSAELWDDPDGHQWAWIFIWLGVVLVVGFIVAHMSIH